MGEMGKMKRSEALEHIEAELKEFMETYNQSSEKARPYKVRSTTDKILSMLEGFGMLPPSYKKRIRVRRFRGISKKGNIMIGKLRTTTITICEWEKEK